MCNELNNLNIDAFSDSELRTLIRQSLPILLQACQTLLNEDDSDQSPCHGCSKAKTCKEPCDLLENILPKIHKGPQNLKHAYGNLINEIGGTNIKDTADNDEILRQFDINYLNAIDRVRADDIYILYKNCSYLFTKTEWRVITLRVEEGLTYKAIGQVLEISTSTASDTFRRAKGRMERHYQKK